MEPAPRHDPALRLSIVLATYNGERHLQEQLDSLAAQTRTPHELVVSDDGSGDRTVEIVEAFAASAPFVVRIVRQPENLGPDQNFGAALGLASGDVVFCCDQDDRWRPDKLARIAGLFESDPELGLVMSDARLVDESMRATGETIWGRFGFDADLRRRVESGDAFAVFARSMPVYGCTIAVRRALAAAYLPVPVGPTFDSWVGQIAAVLAPVRLVPDPLIDYRQHAAQVTGFDEGSRLRRLTAMVGRADAASVRQEVVRLEAMATRLRLLPEGARRDRALEVTVDRLALARRRVTARRSLLLRAPNILVGLLRGEYRRGAQGLRSAAIDLLARPERVL